MEELFKESVTIMQNALTLLYKLKDKKLRKEKDSLIFSMLSYINKSENLSKTKTTGEDKNGDVEDQEDYTDIVCQKSPDQNYDDVEVADKKSPGQSPVRRDISFKDKISNKFKRLRKGNNVDDSLPEENSANDSAKTIEEDLYDETTVEREDIYEDTVIVEEETYDDVETKKETNLEPSLNPPSLPIPKVAVSSSASLETVTQSPTAGPKLPPKPTPDETKKDGGSKPPTLVPSSNQTNPSSTPPLPRPTEEFDFKQDEELYKNVSSLDLYQGMWDCNTNEKDELPFKRGQIVHIISKEYDHDGWWIAKRQNQVGFVPKNYLMEAYKM